MGWISLIKQFFTTIFLLAFAEVRAQFTLQLSIHAVPANHPDSGAIYLAGTFNNWNPSDENFRMIKSNDGFYSIHVNVRQQTGEYKLTRGGWDKVECATNGNDISNRKYDTGINELMGITIEGWKDKILPVRKTSTASKNVRIADTAFYMPQLKRYRVIRIYLPENYMVQRQNRYPVLYMHDGQNVFDDATSFVGEWGVDEFLDTAKVKQCIVVAIDNGGTKRLNEYSPYDFTLNPQKPKENKGEGQQYADFLAKTLKPFIDKKYRTLKDRKNTYITGSSMGGLISLYAVLRYPNVFGGAGIFSPSVWICKKDLLNLIKTTGKKVNSMIYFYCGKLEGQGMVPDMLLAFQELAAVSKSKMTTVIRDDGKHNEPAWRKEFPLFYTWIMYPNWSSKEIYRSH